MDRRINAYAEWLPTTSFPKLLIRGNPGGLISKGNRQLDHALTFANLEVAEVAGNHFLQEDDPQGLGRALSEWIDRKSLDIDQDALPRSASEEMLEGSAQLNRRTGLPSMLVGPGGMKEPGAGC